MPEPNTMSTGDSNMSQTFLGDRSSRKRFPLRLRDLVAISSSLTATDYPMANLTAPRVIWLKGGLFVALGLLASLLLLAQLPDIRYAALLGIAVWAFCRAYYFAFYVIEHYVDPGFRFSSLLDFTRYAIFGRAPDHPDGG